MTIRKKKFSISLLILTFFLIFGLLSYVVINKFQKERDAAKALEPITINLLTNVHPDLPWNFKPLEPKISVRPGEVITIEYIVENLDDNKTTGIATFAYLTILIALLTGPVSLVASLSGTRPVFIVLIYIVLSLIGVNLSEKFIKNEVILKLFSALCVGIGVFGIAYF